MEFFKRYPLSWVALAFALFLFAGYVLTAPPADFPSESIAIVARNASASEIASELASAHIIAHPTLLLFTVRVAGTSGRLRSGAYRFEKPQNLLTVAYRLIVGDYDIPPVRITLPEGETVREVAERVAEALPEISAEDFIREGKQYEGYLFPDTYLFPPSADAESVVATMRDNFNTRTASLSPDLSASGHSLADVTTMASLIEKEARTSEVRRMVAGILWNRIRLGMPLQVDAVFGYIFNRDTYSPSFVDLKVDSPYNTYLHKGLPPGPINNPGLDALNAALHPTETDYLYYLVDKNGVIHYATTYAGHQANRKKYLQ